MFIKTSNNPQMPAGGIHALRTSWCTLPTLHLQISHRDCKCHHCACPSSYPNIKFCISLTSEHKITIITKQRRAEPESEHIYGRVGNVEGFSDIAAELLRIHTAETLQSQVHCAVARQVHQQILSWRNTRGTNDHVRSSMIRSGPPVWRHQIKSGEDKPLVTEEATLPLWEWEGSDGSGGKSSSSPSI